MTRTWIKAPFALVAAAAMLLLLATLSMGSVSAQETEDPPSPGPDQRPHRARQDHGHRISDSHDRE